MAKLTIRMPETPPPGQGASEAHAGSPTTWNGIYGVLDRPTFAAQFRPITRAEYQRAVRWALRRDTWNPYHDVLMEPYGDDQVLLLPACCTPYAWRTLWRKRQEEPRC